MKSLCLDVLLETIPDILELYSTISKKKLFKRINEVKGFSDKTTKNIIDNLPWAIKFVEKWIKQIEYINESFHLIKKIQNKCNFIHSIQNQTNISGYLFEREKDTYSVYLPSLKIVYYLKSFDDMELFKEYNFCIHVFEDEDKMKRRIRLVNHML